MLSIKASNVILNFDKTDARLALSENHLILLLQNIISNGIKYQEKQNQPIINLSFGSKNKLDYRFVKCGFLIPMQPVALY